MPFFLRRILGDVPGVRWLVGGIVAVAVACGLIARIVAPHDFPNYETSFWWALQTVTTVGYGDVVPASNAGRAVASVLMIAGVAFISLFTATISAGFVRRVHSKRGIEDPVLDKLDGVERRLAALEDLLAARHGDGLEP
jgi:voltage-gated potassium channel Kch